MVKDKHRNKFLIIMIHICIFIVIDFFYNKHMNILSIVSRYTKWVYPDINLSLDFFGNFSCIHCSYDVRNIFSNSQPNDIVFTTAIGRVVNLLIFLKTLRTTGSMAQVVIIIDENAYESLTKDTIKSAKECGAQFFIIGVVNTDNNKYIGWYMTLQVMKNNIGKINRAIIVDLYDTVFQGDPFSGFMQSNLLYLADENTKFKVCPLNIEWVENYMDGRRFRKGWMKEFYLCSGYIAGGYHQVVNFLEVIWSKSNLAHYWNDDQGLLNLIYLKNIVPIVAKTDNLTIRHMSFTPYIKSGAIGEVQILLRNNMNFERYAQVIHHYYVDKNLSMSIYKACPRTNPNHTFYHRTVTDKEINELEANNTIY